jgi:Ca2+-binding EF-hand superfamily protein
MQRLRQVFEKMDRNNDGYLNIGEFREAMDALGDHLDGAMVAKVCMAMDIHGRVDFRQFHDIVDEELMLSTSRESLQLSRTLHKTSDNDFKRWLHSY